MRRAALAPAGIYIALDECTTECDFCADSKDRFTAGGISVHFSGAGSAAYSGIASTDGAALF